MSAVRRISLFGPESTGKTTLAERLAAHYGTCWVPEFAREYVDRRLARLQPGAPLVEEADLRPIVEGQLRAEEAAATRARRVLFCDTDPLQTAVYAEHYFGRCPAWLEALAGGRRYELTLLLAIDVPWRPDPQRDRPLQRTQLYELFRLALVRYERTWVPIEGDWAQRERAARVAVDALLSD
jgi:NadR type nicotinamide-nucleotide adenylyltransferase